MMNENPSVVSDVFSRTQNGVTLGALGLKQGKSYIVTRQSERTGYPIYICFTAINGATADLNTTNMVKITSMTCKDSTYEQSMRKLLTEKDHYGRPVNKVQFMTDCFFVNDLNLFTPDYKFRLFEHIF